MTPPDTNQSDAELAGRVRDPTHGPAAFRLLYDRHAGNLLAFALARHPERADDICQEAWTRTWRALRGAGCPAMTHFRGWLFTMARNLGIDMGRAKQAAPLAEACAATDPSPGAAEQLVRAERLHAVRDCFEALTRAKPHYGAVVRAFLDGERPEAAARRLGISRDNFDQRKKRALAALQECLEQRLP